MAWPSTAVATGELITAAQLNGLPVMIANSTLSGDAASFDVTSIPSHYAHLMVVCYARSDTGSSSAQIGVRFNNDSSAIYDYQNVMGQAAVASASETFATTFALIGNIPGNTAGANLFGVQTFTVPHYAGTANNKACSSESGFKVGTATTNLVVQALAGFWRSNAAINRITVFTSGNFRAGSRFTLYGLA
jgi:hypothetical protein